MAYISSAFIKMNLKNTFNYLMIFLKFSRLLLSVRLELYPKNNKKHGYVWTGRHKNNVMNMFSLYYIQWTNLGYFFIVHCNFRSLNKVRRLSLTKLWSVLGSFWTSIFSIFPLNLISQCRQGFRFINKAYMQMFYQSLNLYICLSGDRNRAYQVK